MRVLSIDWDYFMDASYSERMMLFPDGGNEELPEVVQSIIWGGRYGDPRLAKIGVVKSAVAKTKEIIKRGETGDTFYMIVDSHKHIYDFVCRIAGENSENIEVYNIDFHHDLYGKITDEKLNCGNWIYQLMKRFRGLIEFKWIARKDSEEMKFPRFKTVVEDLSVLNGMKFEIIFICRSGMWSPPHLDGEFKKAFEWIAKTKRVYLQEGIFESRYTKEFRRAVKEHRDMIDGIKKGIK